MSETTTRTWVIEHDWKCGHCHTLNKGREDKCTACGKPIDDTHEELVPSNMSYENRVKDTRIFEDQGPDWICKYCSHRNRGTKEKCEECGSDRSEKKQTVSSGQVTIPGSKVPAPRRDSKDRPEYFEEFHSSSAIPQRIANPDFQKEEKESAKAYKPISSSKAEPVHYRSPQYSEDATTPPTSFNTIDRVLGGIFVTSIILALVSFLYYLFAWHKETARVSKTEWTYVVSVSQRSVRQGRSWRDQEPPYSFNESCVFEIRSYHNCNPRNCNPHQVSYDCNCRDVQFCSPRTSCRTVCTSRGNRSSSCSERCSTSTYCTSRRSCQTCYRTEYDTCYDRCPDYDQMCSYSYPTWSSTRSATLTGQNHNPVRPSLRAESNLTCPNDPERLHIANNQVVDCQRDAITYSVQLSMETQGVRDITPVSAAEYDQYQIGAIWEVEYNRAGQVRVLGRRQ